MTPLPTLPTDNLYKFCAISGLAIILVSGYASWSITNALFKLKNQQTLAIEKAALESEFINKSFDVTQRSHADLLYNQKNRDLIAEGKSPEESSEARERLRVPLSPADVHRQLEEEIASSKRILLDKLEIEARLAEMNWVADERIVIRWITAAGMLGGAALSFYGFRNWRTLQIHQDKLFLAQTRLDK